MRAQRSDGPIRPSNRYLLDLVGWPVLTVGARAARLAGSGVAGPGVVDGGVEPVPEGMELSLQPGEFL